MLIEKYFNERIKSIKQQDRYNLASREIYTFKTLLKISNIYAYFIADSKRKNIPQEEHSTIRNIVDVGCGDKFLEEPLVKLGCNYIGLDVNDLDFEKDKFNLADNSIDCVFALGVIEHLSNPANILSEIYRILRPGGIVYCSTPNFPLCIHSFYDDPTHIRPYTVKSISFLVHSFGFVNTRCFPNLRVKPAWCYQGPFKFWRAKWLHPIRSDSRFWVPSFLKGKSKGIFLLCQKPSKTK